MAGLDAFKRGCDLGDSRACQKAATIVEFDKSFPDSEERILRERSCALGEHTDCWAVAQWHARGSHGYTRDHAQYKVFMKESARLEGVAAEKWTAMRRGIQEDAVRRLGKARITWKAELLANNSRYCIRHPTGSTGYVEGTIAEGKVEAWQRCPYKKSGGGCEEGKGAPPSTMERVFDDCEKILSGSPAIYDFGFYVKPKGGVSCYSHAEGSELRGESQSATIRFGSCQ